MPVRRPTRPSGGTATRSDDDFREPPEEGVQEGRSSRGRGETTRRSADDADERPRGRHTPEAREESPSEGRSARRGGDEEKRTRPAARGGWDGWEQTASETSTFPDRFSVDYEESKIVAFLDKGPFHTFGEHWLDDAPGKRKSFDCLGRDNDCPICDGLGSKPKGKAIFDLIEFVGDAGIPKARVWTVGSGVIQQLKVIAEDDKRGPLTDGYWAISKTKTGAGNTGSTVYSFQKIKERDLKEDEGIDPLTDEEWKEFEAEKHDGPLVDLPRRSELVELVDAINRRG